MRISHKHKFIWISKPKTGSTSYRKLLDPYSDIRSVHSGPFKHHVTLNDLKQTFEEKDWNFNEYYKVIACRNPWSLLLSLYTYSKTDVHGVKFWENKSSYTPEKRMSFSDWINLNEHHEWFKAKHRLEVYADDDLGQNLSDLVFAADQPSETFKKSMEEQCNLVLPMDSLKILNTTEKSSDLIDEVKDNYNSLGIDKMIRAIYTKEINLFNYENPYKNK